MEFKGLILALGLILIIVLTVLSSGFFVYILVPLLLFIIAVELIDIRITLKKNK